MYYSGDNLEFKRTSEIKPTLEEELRGNTGEPVTFPKPLKNAGQAPPRKRQSFLRGRLRKLFLLQAVAATAGVSALLSGYGIDFLGDLFPPDLSGQTEDTTEEETTGDETTLGGGGGVNTGDPEVTTSAPGDETTEDETTEEITPPETEETSSPDETSEPDETTDGPEETTAPEDTSETHVHTFGALRTTLEPTCTEAGEAEQVCSGCGYVEKVPVDPLGHDVVNDQAVAASCTATGLSAGTHCSRCGTVFHAQTVLAALGHDFGEWTTATAATCTADGSEKHTCSRCGLSETQTIAATGHTPVTDQPVAATCTAAGLTAGSHCSTCGTVIRAQSEIKALGHDFGAWTTVNAATCTADGSEERTCSRCGLKETQTLTAAGHTVVTDQAVDPTCTATGLTAGSHCSVCGTVITAQTQIQALGHDFDKWTTVNAATCTADGSEKRTCARCGTVETQTISATGHTVVNDDAVAATCTETGLTAGTHCSVCGTVFRAQTTTSALGHDFGEWTTVTAATCTADGSEKHTCSRCGVSETQTVSATGHTPVTDQPVAATCTATGLTAGSHCSVCGTVIRAQTEIAALGHDFGAWTTVNAATCTADGSEERTCSRCGVSETQTVSATGHTVVADQAVAATCTATGLTAGSHCSVCGTVITAQTQTSALGHNFGAWTTINAATCTADGSEERTCSRCGATETQTISATGHTVVNDAAVAATCTETGLSAGTHCSVCGTVLRAQKTTEALGHDFGQWTTVNAPTCTADGSEQHTCSRCGVTETQTVPATGHTVVVDQAEAATCTEPGLTEGTHCSVCGVVLTSQERTQALGHNYGEWTVTTPASCLKEGAKERTCSRCGETENGVIEATGHTPSTVPKVPATCTEDGFTAYTVCSVCGDTLEQGSVIPATGHSYDSTTGICSACGSSVLSYYYYDNYEQMYGSDQSLLPGTHIETNSEDHPYEIPVGSERILRLEFDGLESDDWYLVGAEVEWDVATYGPPLGMENASESKMLYLYPDEVLPNEAESFDLCILLTVSGGGNRYTGVRFYVRIYTD